jgi:uncharacterized membrane protein
MADNDLSPEAIRQLIERLGYLEDSVQQQVARLYAIEQRMGIRPAPARPVVEPRQPPPERRPVEPPPPMPPPPIAASRIEPVAQIQTPVETRTIPRTSDVDPAPPKSTPPWFSLEGKDLESLIGGNWFNRIGILCIILSVGFFLKIAFENQWIGPTGKVMTGVLIGVGFLLGGERMRAKGYRYYAHGLSGGGIAILYLAFFASFARYHLIGQTPAFALMAMTTATAVLLAARYNALAIAILGLIGGFLTPILLSTGTDNQIGLFSYITLLDLGVLSLAYFKKWRVLNFLAYGATVLMSAGWASEWYAPEKLWTTVFFFTVLFVVFALLAILNNVLNRTPIEWPETLLVMLNAGLYFGACYMLLESRYSAYLGLFAVLVSAFYLGLGYLTFARHREDRYLVLSFLGLASLFLTLAVPIQFNQQWVTLAWAIEGVILTWIGLRADSRLTRYAALAVFAIASFHWLEVDLGEFGFRGTQDFIPFLNRRAVSAVVLIVCLSGAITLYRRFGDKVNAEEKLWLSGVLAAAANGLALLWLSLDLRDYFEQAKAPLLARTAQEPWQWDAVTWLDSVKHLLLTLLWCVYAAALMLIGLAKKLQLARWAALGLLALAGFKVIFLDAQYAAAPWRSLILNPAFGSFAILTATLTLIYWRYSRAKSITPTERDLALPVLLAATNLIALIGLSVEVNGHFAARSRAANASGDLAARASTRQFSLTALWSVYAAVALGVAFKRGNKWLRYGSLALLFLVAVKVLAVDLFQAIPGRTPLLNLTFTAFTAVIAGFAYSYWLVSRAGDGGRIGRFPLRSLLLFTLNLLGVFALSVESEGYFNAAMRPIENQTEAWIDANLARQLWLSVIWAVYGGGMLIVGILRRNKLLRLMALALLGMTILKVFLVDLSSLDRIYRVISFVVLGVILLAVSFLYQQSQQRIAGGKK